MVLLVVVSSKKVVCSGKSGCQKVTGCACCHRGFCYYFTERGGWVAGVEGKLPVVTRWCKVDGAGSRSRCTESEREGSGLVLKRKRQRKTRDNAGERKRERG